MPLLAEKPVSLVQAARTLYRTQSPSEEQIDRVFMLMKTGALPAREGGANRWKWTTSDTALAEFMAQRKMLRGGANQRSPAADQQDHADKLQRVYHNILRDYFLAVMLRRRTAHRSIAFRRAVLAGQVLFLLLLLGAVLGSVRQISWLTAAPAEQVAVERWIDEHTEAYAVEKWHPAEPYAEGEGLLVRVEYRYRNNSARWIHTKRAFNVVGEDVTEVSFD